MMLVFFFSLSLSLHRFYGIWPFSLFFSSLLSYVYEKWANVGLKTFHEMWNVIDFLFSRCKTICNKIASDSIGIILVYCIHYLEAKVINLNIYSADRSKRKKNKTNEYLANIISQIEILNTKNMIALIRLLQASKT